MASTTRLNDYVSLTAKQPEPGDRLLTESLCADLPALAGWMALPAGFSVLLWGILLTAVFT